MKEINKFQCEHCNVEYKSKIDAMDCEKNHKMPEGINNAISHMRFKAKNDDHSGYPQSVNIKFDDGKTIKFKRC